MTNINWSMFLYFVILNLIYVIMNTISNILCIKGSKKVSSIASAVCYGFYTIVLKTIVGCDTFTTVVGTIVSNIVGRYLGMWLSPIFIGRPITSYKLTLDIDSIWYDILCNELEENNIKYHYIECQNRYLRKWLKFSIYPVNKEQDKIIDHFLQISKIKAQHKEEY